MRLQRCFLALKRAVYAFCDGIGVAKNQIASEAKAIST